MLVLGWRGQRRGGALALGPPPSPDLAPGLTVASGPEARHRELHLLQGTGGQPRPEGGRRRPGSHRGHWRELGGQWGVRHRPGEEAAGYSQSQQWDPVLLTPSPESRLFPAQHTHKPLALTSRASPEAACWVPLPLGTL